MAAIWFLLGSLNLLLEILCDCIVFFQALIQYPQWTNTVQWFVHMWPVVTFLQHASAHLMWQENERMGSCKIGQIVKLIWFLLSTFEYLCALVRPFVLADLLWVPSFDYGNAYFRPIHMLIYIVMYVWIANIWDHALLCLLLQCFTLIYMKHLPWNLYETYVKPMWNLCETYVKPMWNSYYNALL